MNNPLWGNIFKKKVSESAEILKLLSSSPVFQTINKSNLKKIERIIHIRQYNEGELVFKEDEPGVGMYVVKEGEVEVSIKDPDTKEEQIVAKFTSGQTFGDVALFSDDALRTATIKASKKTSLLGFCRPDLLGLIERDPLLGAKILNNLLIIAGKRLHSNNNQLNSAHKRIEELEKKLQEV